MNMPSATKTSILIRVHLATQQSTANLGTSLVTFYVEAGSLDAR
jgi:hypothetical protein